MASIVETQDSRAFSGNAHTYKYVVWGTVDPAEVVALVDATAPDAVGGSPRGTISYTPQYDFWQVSIPYSTREASVADVVNGAGEDPGPQGPGQGGGNVAGDTLATQEIGREISFSTGGGTQTLYRALKHIKSYAPIGKKAPNHMGAINVSGNEIRGVEVKAPSGNFSITKKIPLITVGYFVRLMAMTATTNDKPYIGFDTGELLLAGADGNYKDGEAWSFSCRFEYEPNETELIFGDEIDLDHTIYLVEKRGHQYLWVESELVEDTLANPKRMVLRPFAVHVEQVYKESDFNVLGLHR